MGFCNVKIRREVKGFSLAVYTGLMELTKKQSD